MRYPRDLQLVIVIVLLILTHIPSVSAWDITPKATELDKMIKGFQSINFWSFWGDEISEYLIKHYTIPVHEVITHRIYGCEYDFKFCSSPPSPYRFASDALIAGVRWNDNPRFELTGSTGGAQKDCVGVPIYLPNNAICWAKLFYDAKMNPGINSRIIWNAFLTLRTQMLRPDRGRSFPRTSEKGKRDDSCFN